MHFLQWRPSTSLCGYYIFNHLWLDLTCHYVVLTKFFNKQLGLLFRSRSLYYCLAFIVSIWNE
ncbi:hypothetical protein PRUPE_6G114900 [Prunus persica]|uniref:Uncharacterized protein n=1 Tax=Prunus persica TaxID=3760 RepID=A0A251NQH6_PRUPE|nr:hypothetical protein PRUPE_6G114900 [Prunus persica]